MKFLVGDKVRKADRFEDKTFSNGAEVVTISKIDGNDVYFEETGTWCFADGLELVERPKTLEELQQERIVELEDECMSKETYIEQLEREIEQLRDDYEQKTADFFEACQEDIADARKELEELKRELKEAHREIARVGSERDRFRREYENEKAKVYHLRKAMKEMLDAVEY